MGQDVFARRLWDVLTGVPPPVPPTQYPFLASFTYYAFTIFLTRVLSSIIASSCRHTPRLRAYAGDVLFAFSMCACSLENAMIGYHYGPWAYAGVVFVIGMWFCYLVPIGVNSSPLANADDFTSSYLRGRISLSTYSELLIRTCVQIVGARLSYSYAQLWWYIELTDRHGYRYLSPSCKTDLKLPLAAGMGLEFSGTFILLMLFFTLPRIINSNLLLNVLNSAAGVALTMIGLPLTGSYMNPINASNQTFGCKGLSNAHHLLTYWLAPLTAAVIVPLIIHKYSKGTGSHAKENGNINGVINMNSTTNGVTSNGRTSNNGGTMYSQNSNHKLRSRGVNSSLRKERINIEHSSKTS